MVKSKWICIDDVNWVEKSEQTLPFDLDCLYQGVSAISVVRSILYHSFKIDIPSWVNSAFSRADCTDEIIRWSTYQLNLTYTIQTECDNNLQRNPGLRQGVRCILTKNYLRREIFKMNRLVLETRKDIYPYAYGLNVIYTCV